jgi:hypothetical protein
LKVEAAIGKARELLLLLLRAFAGTKREGSDVDDTEVFNKVHRCGVWW